MKFFVVVICTSDEEAPKVYKTYNNYYEACEAKAALKNAFNFVKDRPQVYILDTGEIE